MSWFVRRWLSHFRRLSISLLRLIWLVWFLVCHAYQNASWSPFYDDLTIDLGSNHRGELDWVVVVLLYFSFSDSLFASQSSKSGWEWCRGSVYQQTLQHSSKYVSTKASTKSLRIRRLFKDLQHKKGGCIFQPQQSLKCLISFCV